MLQYKRQVFRRLAVTRRKESRAKKLQEEKQQRQEDEDEDDEEDEEDDEEIAAAAAAGRSRKNGSASIESDSASRDAEDQAETVYVFANFDCEAALEQLKIECA